MSLFPKRHFNSDDEAPQTFWYRWCGKLVRFALVSACLLLCYYIYTEHQLTLKYLARRERLEQTLLQSNEKFTKELVVRSLGSTTTARSWLVSIPSGMEISFTIDSGSERQSLFTLPRRSKSYRGTFHLEASEGNLHFENLDNKTKTFPRVVQFGQQAFVMELVRRRSIPSASTERPHTSLSKDQQRQLQRDRLTRSRRSPTDPAQGLSCGLDEELILARFQQIPSIDPSSSLAPITYELKVHPSPVP